MTETETRISIVEAEIALSKYGIEFGFPGSCTFGDQITVWSDYYHRTKGNTMKLIGLIDGDPLCPFKTKPSMMMCTFRLVRKDPLTH